MATKHTMHVPVGIASSDVWLTVTYTIHPGRPAVMYLRNGDPGYPEEPTELDIHSITVGTETIPIWMENILTEHIYEWICEHHEEPEREYEREYD